MHVIPPALERLINELGRFPGIGEKTATRLALYILRKPATDAKRLSETLGELHTSITLCSTCYTFSETTKCDICSDIKRKQNLVCVVEEPGDLLAIENTGAYKGIYHILHGSLAPMDGIGPQELKIKELAERIKKGGIDELLLATSSTVPGEATASFIANMFLHSPVKVSRLACGIPMGMDIKYADIHTLGKAIESRQPIE